MRVGDLSGALEDYAIAIEGARENAELVEAALSLEMRLAGGSSNPSVEADGSAVILHVERPSLERGPLSPGYIWINDSVIRRLVE